MLREKEFFDKDEITVNIWDDYYDDDHIPEGEIQQTHIYVEESDLPFAEQRNVLQLVLSKISELQFEDDIEFALTYDIQANEAYPWRIYVKHLTHERREQLVEELKQFNLKYRGIPLKILSES